jgi:rhamnogalacturonyl hydrolase YesR
MSRSSPIGAYAPEMLILRPEEGEDGNTMSLVAQCLELGLAIELTDDWRLPTAPPRDLGSYKCCLFPESSRERYDRDLDAFHRAGGYLGYFKYYPRDPAPPPSGLNRYAWNCGRDSCFYHMANVMIEGGLTVGHPDFIQALEQRSVPQIHADVRQTFFGVFGARDLAVWPAWGDPQYTMLYAYLALADATHDTELLDLVRYCLKVIVASRGEAFKRRTTENQLTETVEINIALFAEMLMHLGERFKDQEMMSFGLELGRLWVGAAEQREGMYFARYMRYLWSESFSMAPCLYWMTRLTGESRYAAAADAVVERTISRNQRDTGIWSHWSDDSGRTGAAWSRGNYWSALWMTQALYALERSDTVRRSRIMESLTRAFDGLMGYQDRDRGLWHLVVDEPATRLETSAAAGLVYVHDRLRDLGLAAPAWAPMADRAFAGLKSMYYRGGLAASCRGTSTGVPQYYRTRPLGYYTGSLFPALVGCRMPGSAGR